MYHWWNAKSMRCRTHLNIPFFLCIEICIKWLQWNLINRYNCLVRIKIIDFVNLVWGKTTYICLHVADIAGMWRVQPKKITYMYFYICMKYTVGTIRLIEDWLRKLHAPRLSIFAAIKENSLLLVYLMFLMNNVQNIILESSFLFFGYFITIF